MYLSYKLVHNNALVGPKSGFTFTLFRAIAESKIDNTLCKLVILCSHVIYKVIYDAIVYVR